MDKAEQILEKHINENDLNFIFHENKDLWQELLNAANEALGLAHVSGSLPTDEEIAKQAKKYDVEDMNDAINRIGGFIVGAKWMRNLLFSNDR